MESDELKKYVELLMSMSLSYLMGNYDEKLYKKMLMLYAQNISETKTYTISDMKETWEAAENYREQLDRIHSSNSNFLKTTYPDYVEYFSDK